MRIQHNIMAMNAYRNYNNNTSALSKNLEKLSSGYKINRAGDDAAGLAISEKMRAQITGLNAAQKNVKDGISLVKTAEGAMQEVQDMLNRMDYLATQSANGTYDNEVDRDNLQKEVTALKEEINRIADSANFNGIKLLDGSQEKAGAKTVTVKGSERILSDVIKDGEKAWNVEGAKTILDTTAAAATTGAFKVDLTTLTFTGIGTTAGTDAQSFKLTIGTKTWTATKAVTGKATATSATIMKQVAAAIASKIGGTATFNGCKWTVANASGVLTFTQKAKPATAAQAKYDWDVAVSYTAPASNATKGFTMDASHLEGTQVTKMGAAAESANMANTVFKITADDIRDGATITIGSKTVTLAVGKDSQVDTTKNMVVNLKNMEEGKVNLYEALAKMSVKFGTTAQADCLNVLGKASKCTFKIGVNDGSNGQPTGITVQRQTAIAAATAASGIGDYFNTKDRLAGIFSMSYTKAATKGLTLQIGDTSDPFNQMSVSVKDMHTSAMGIDSVDISSQDGAAKAVQTVKDAINYVSSIRGDLGAIQNRLEHTQNNLSVMAENIQDAESTIRDTDVAEEMMSYVKNNILVQSAQAMLAQANQVPQGVLQLLG